MTGHTIDRVRYHRLLPVAEHVARALGLTSDVLLEGRGPRGFVARLAFVRAVRRFGWDEDAAWSLLGPGRAEPHRRQRTQVPRKAALPPPPALLDTVEAMRASAEECSERWSFAA